MILSSKIIYEQQFDAAVQKKEKENKKHITNSKNQRNSPSTVMAIVNRKKNTKTGVSVTQQQ